MYLLVLIRVVVVFSALPAHKQQNRSSYNPGCRSRTLLWPEKLLRHIPGDKDRRWILLPASLDWNDFARIHLRDRAHSTDALSPERKECQFHKNKELFCKSNGR